LQTNQPTNPPRRRYFVVALKHAQELAGQVKLAAAASLKGRGVEMQEQVEMMLLDVFLEGLFEMDLRRVNSEEVGGGETDGWRCGWGRLAWWG
jgi:hypothetical protein